jgi:hypothetical protein
VSIRSEALFPEPKKTRGLPLGQNAGDDQTGPMEIDSLAGKREHRSLNHQDQIGVACQPGGVIKTDGSVEKGRRTSPATGRAASSICRPSLVEAIPQIGDHDTAIVMHNDGVVQGALRSPLHAGRETMRNIDDRHGARQRALHQSQRQG